MALQLTRGVIRGAQKGLIYGVAGIGKSFLSAQIEKLIGPVVFLDSEDGTKELDVARYSITKHEELFQAIDLVQASGEFKALVIDSIDWIEKLLAQKVCDKGDEKGVKKDRIEDFGYGKGWKYLREELEKFLFRLDAVLRKGIHVILIGHSEVVKFQEPEKSEAYDRYELKLDKENSANVREWCGFVLFANWKTSVIESENKKSVGVGGKERILYTQHSAGWDAKNRHGLPDKCKMVIESLAPIFGNTAIPQVTKERSNFDRILGAIENIANPVTQGSAVSELTAQSGKSDIPEIVGEFIEATGELDIDLLKRFLVNRGVITITESLMQVPEAYAKAAVDRIKDFKTSVENFGKQNA